MEPTTGAGPAAGPIEQVLRGRVVLGRDLRSFVPCEDGEVAWVVDETPGADLGEVYRALATPPDSPIFVEVRGHYGPPPDRGPGSDYASQLTVSELRRAAPEGPGCGEDIRAFEFRALGNEPFWSVRVAEEGIALTRIGESSPIRFPFVAPEHGADVVTYSSVTELPHHEISLELRRERCTDTMSGARFAYSARLRVDGREMTGCAYEGLPPSRGPIRYTIRTIERTVPGCGADGSQACAWFRFDYPELGSGLPPAAHDAIESEIDAWIRRPLAEGREPASPEELIARWERDWQEFHERFPDSAQGRRIERTVSVLAVGQDYVSLAMRETTDLGGAHPNESVTLRSFDRHGGEVLTIDGIVAPDRRDELTRLAEKEFRRIKALAPDTSLAEAGYWFEGDRFTLGDNFALTATGLRFRFDAYQIAPYSMGATTLDLPWSVVAPLLRQPQEKGRPESGAPIESLVE